MTDSRIHGRRSRAAAALIAATAAVALLGACGSSGSGGDGNPLAPAKAAAGQVVVGSNNFAESILLADIYGEALKAKGLKVSYKPNIGSRETTYGLIKNGSLTVLPEYNGALLAYLDPKAVPTSADATDSAAAAKLDPALQLLRHAAAEDKDAVVVNQGTAAKYHLTADSSIADLASAAHELVLGGSPEFQTRQQGVLGLKSVYGLDFKSFKALDAGGALSEAALKKNDVQAADLFTTDFTIAKEKFITLKDPKNLFGFQNVVPLVRKDDLPQKGVDALNAVSAKLDTTTLLDLDTKVQADKKDPLDVATEWLKSVGLS
ncbi:ABC transporter substrate-binding protein [Streptacidiphilus griseoplanus]|uniref:ABC transporter substrate-binding protein n=1 Tax=Peterkaempfera griseoplana TaxID=66896 RepID=UPI001FE1558E|nr:ABC transporter substrate-binding protein [Peterkaempfera griseoplana]